MQPKKQVGHQGTPGQTEITESNYMTNACCNRTGERDGKGAHPAVENYAPSTCSKAKDKENCAYN